MNQIYKEDFSDWDDVCSAFKQSWDYDSPKLEMSEPKYVFTAYGEDFGYDGWAFVLYSNDGVEFFSVHGSHCSCNGLEGQWTPNSETKETILHTAKGDSKYSAYGQYGEEVTEWINRISGN